MQKKTRRVLLVAFLFLYGWAAVLVAQRRPPIHWVSGGETLVVMHGETFDFEAEFFSDIPISNAHWWVSQGLDPLFIQTGSVTPIGNVEANHVYTIRHRIFVPEGLETRLFQGELQVYHHKESGNQSVQVFPEVLQLKFYVMEASPKSSGRRDQRLLGRFVSPRQSSKSQTRETTFISEGTMHVSMTAGAKK